MSLSMLAKISGSDFNGCDQAVSGVSIDTRTLEKGALFVAIKGENFNGHDFVTAAQQKGAVAVMVSESVTTALPCLKVSDTLSGLQRMAAKWRDRFNLPLVAVTGSNGKTTVKELIGSIATVRYRDVLVTEGNLNNHLGVPLTLLRLNDRHRCAVIEMGMNHPGEISRLTRLAKPDVALVNNAMLAHVEAFDSVRDVAAAKSEIFEGLSVPGTAVLNADDPNYEFIKARAGSHRYIDFGLKAKAMVTAALQYRRQYQSLEVCTPRGEISIKLYLLGKHNAMNALAAAACALALEIDLDCIKEGIEQIKPLKGRLQPVKLAGGRVVLDDTYNANPDSMKAGINVLAQMPGAKKILVAGDMAELGEHSPELHAMVGEYAATCKIDAFLSYGPLMEVAANAFGPQAYNTQQIEPLIGRLVKESATGSVILVKGSRSMRMERIVESLKSRYQGGEI